MNDREQMALDLASYRRDSEAVIDAFNDIDATRFSGSS